MRFLKFTVDNASEIYRMTIYINLYHVYDVYNFTIAQN